MTIPAFPSILRQSSFLLAGLLLLPAPTASSQKLDASDPGFKRMQHHTSQEEYERNLPKSSSLTIYSVPPDTADPTVHRFLRNSFAYIDRAAVQPNAELFLYLVGTKGTPDNAKRLPTVAASQGYRVIALMYNSLPATAEVCQRNPDTTCSQNFRNRRAFGDTASTEIDDTPAESVTARLSALLKYLNAQHPQDGWSQYLLADDSPNWPHIVIAGHSQGAGLAAFIAKKQKVARVVLFSDWDVYVANGHHHPVPWLAWKSATPADRWWALYHQQEPMAKYIQMTYDTLNIPASHVRKLNLAPRKANEFHTSVSGDTTTPLDDKGQPAYLPIWKELIGNPTK